MFNFDLSSRLSAFALTLQSVSGWRRAALAFFIGATMALAMPPVNFFPVVFFALPALIFMLWGATSSKQAFAIGWCFAFGFFVFGLYWIAASMFVDIKHFWWAVPFAVAGLPAFFAVYYGLACVIAHRLGLKDLGGVVAFGLLWFLADFARGHVLTGFPWNLLGYAWSGVLPVLQSTSVFGIYGLTLATCVAAALPASLAFGGKASRIATSLAVLFFIGLALSGTLRLMTTHTENFPSVRVRLVQPNISQATKWMQSRREANFERLLDLSVEAAEKPVTHIFWPETATTFYLSEDSFRRHEIARRIPASTSIITGALRRSVNEEGHIKFFNSLIAINRDGSVVAGYDKAHLVPFGEYMPLRSVLHLNALAAGDADFSAGPGPQTLRVPALPLMSPLICYEAIFPGQVVDPQDKPEFMANITNDGWYGNSSGPYQHFSIVQVRAIEEGMTLIRIANTGISGIIDPSGRVVARLGLDKQGIVDGDIPKPLPDTLFVRYGNFILWGSFGVLLAFTFLYKTRKKQYYNRQG